MRKTISLCLVAVCTFSYAEIHIKSDVTSETGNILMPVDEMHYDIQNKYVVAYASHPVICNAQVEQTDNSLAIKWFDPNLVSQTRNIIPLANSAEYDFQSKVMTATSNDIKNNVCLTYTEHDYIFKDGLGGDTPVASDYDSETVIELYDSIGGGYVDALKLGYVINTNLSQGLVASPTTLFQYEIHVENLLPSAAMTGVNLVDYVPTHSSLSAYFDPNTAPNTLCEIHTINPSTQAYEFTEMTACFIGANSDITLQPNEKLVYLVSRMGVLLPQGATSGHLEMMSAVFKRKMSSPSDLDYRSFMSYGSTDLKIAVN